MLYRSLPLVIGNRDAQVPGSLYQRAAQNFSPSAGHLSPWPACSIDSPSLFEGKKMPCDVLSIVKDELTSLSPRRLSRSHPSAPLLLMPARARLNVRLRAGWASHAAHPSDSQQVTIDELDIRPFLCCEFHQQIDTLIPCFPRGK